MSKRIVLTSILLLWPAASVLAVNEGRLCFTRGDYVFVQEPNGRPRRLVKGYQPSISPDGNIIAFVVAQGEWPKSESHVSLIDIQTGKVRAISTLNPFNSFRPLWSPDGGRLAVQLVMNQTPGFAIVDATSENLYVIPANLQLEFGWLNSWTADGKSIVLNSLEHVYQVALDGHVIRKLAMRELVGAVDISSLSRFSFSPDGRFLLFNSAMVPDDVGIASIYLYDLRARRLSRLTSDHLGALDPQWLPSGNEIVFTGYIKGRYKPRSRIPSYRIYRISINGKNPRMIIRDAEDASYSLPR